MRRAALFALWALFAAMPAAAQESVFNLPTLGVPSSGEPVRARALGGAGFGLDREPFSLEAPAQLARFGRAGVHFSAIGQRLTVENAASTGELEDVSFPMGQVVFPAWAGTALAMGFYQFVDFDAAITSEILFEGDTLPLSLSSSGGITVLAPAIAWAPNDRTALGASLDVYLGSRDIIRRVGTEDLTPGAVVTADSLTRDFRAAGFSLSAEQRLGSGETRLVAAWRWRPTIESEVTDAPSGGLEGTSADYKLPSELSLGGTTRLSRRATISAILRWSDWSAFDDPAGSEYDSSVEVGGGIELEPGTRWLWMFGPGAPLRAGLRWRRLPLRVGGETVEEWVASVGHGRSFFAGWSRFDLVLEAGRRGDVDTHGLSERFVRLGVGLSAFEQWRRDAPNRP